MCARGGLALHATYFLSICRSLTTSPITSSFVTNPLLLRYLGPNYLLSSNSYHNKIIVHISTAVPSNSISHLILFTQSSSLHLLQQQQHHPVDPPTLPKYPNTTPQTPTRHYPTAKYSRHVQTCIHLTIS